MPIPDDKIALILELYLNNEMEKREVIKAIQRLSIGAFEQEKSDQREKARKSEKLHPIPKDYMRWSDADSERLMVMRAEGYEYHIIARELRRTVRSIRTKYLEVLGQEKETARIKVGKNA